MKKLMSTLLAFVSLICLAFAGCGENNKADVSGIVEENAADMIILENWRFTSGIANNVIAFNADADVNFELNMERGSCLGFINEKNFTVTADKRLSWQSIFDDQNEFLQEGEKTYIDVIARKEDYIIGYGVIKIECINPINFKATVLKSVVFPEVNGVSQNITVEQVGSLLADARETENQ